MRVERIVGLTTVFSFYCFVCGHCDFAWWSNELDVRYVPVANRVYSVLYLTRCYKSYNSLGGDLNVTKSDRKIAKVYIINLWYVRVLDTDCTIVLFTNQFITVFSDEIIFIINNKTNRHHSLPTFLIVSDRFLLIYCDYKQSYVSTTYIISKRVTREVRLWTTI